MGTPWTRDGAVRAYVVTMAPEVSGRIVLMVIDPTNYRIAVSLGEAAVDQAKAAAQNARAESERRQKLTTLSTSEEVKQTFASSALAAEAAHRQMIANLDQARGEP